MGHPNNALMDFSQAIHHDTEDKAEYYNWSGRCYHMMEQWEDALKMFDKAVSKNKYGGEYYYNRALVKAKLDRFPEAIKDYDKAIQNDSGAGRSNDQQKYNAKFNKGICLRNIGDLDKSITVLREAVDMKSDDPSAHNNLGKSYFESKDFDNAINCYTKAIQHSGIEKGDTDPEKKQYAAQYYNN